MATAQHTPGPWRLDPEHNYDIESADGHFQIALVRDESDDLLLDRQYAPGPSEAEANARLIAAAPDLLQALREAVDVLAEQKTGKGTVNRFLAAIAKAEGR